MLHGMGEAIVLKCSWLVKSYFSFVAEYTSYFMSNLFKWCVFYFSEFSLCAGCGEWVPLPTGEGPHTAGSLSC